MSVQPPSLWNISLSFFLIFLTLTVFTGCWFCIKCFNLALSHAPSASIQVMIFGRKIMEKWQYIQFLVCYQVEQDFDLFPLLVMFIFFSSLDFLCSSPHKSMQICPSTPKTSWARDTLVSTISVLYQAQGPTALPPPWKELWWRQWPMAAGLQRDVYRDGKKQRKGEERDDMLLWTTDRIS